MVSCDSNMGLRKPQQFDTHPAYNEASMNDINYVRQLHDTTPMMEKIGSSKGLGKKVSHALGDGHVGHTGHGTVRGLRPPRERGPLCYER